MGRVPLQPMERCGFCSSWEPGTFAFIVKACGVLGVHQACCQLGLLQGKKKSFVEWRARNDPKCWHDLKSSSRTESPSSPGLLSCSLLGVAELEGSSFSPIQDVHKEFWHVPPPQLPVPHVTKFAHFPSNQRRCPDAPESGLSCL